MVSERKEFKRMPRLGDTVIYTVNENDDEAITHNHAAELPAVVVCVWSVDCVNLKVLTDGPRNGWKTSVLRGREPGQWFTLPTGERVGLNEEAEFIAD